MLICVYPDRTFDESRQNLCSSETSIVRFWGFKVISCSVGMCIIISFMPNKSTWQLARIFFFTFSIAFQQEYSHFEIKQAECISGIEVDHVKNAILKLLWLKKTQFGAAAATAAVVDVVVVAADAADVVVVAFWELTASDFECVQLFDSGSISALLVSSKSDQQGGEEVPNQFLIRFVARNTSLQRCLKGELFFHQIQLEIVKEMWGAAN